eukprot:TRINITY_DN5775_c0_g2_i1.p1 TRINITY_DN5775_c0_g2~~TRINITY_DN5775_c0_g2_i1.p1  ORF type:complete len:491 (-),score=56.00 TRINITY_DN5775_c0_g2_i1:6-1478(-)
METTERHRHHDAGDGTHSHEPRKCAMHSHDDQPRHAGHTPIYRIHQKVDDQYTQGLPIVGCCLVMFLLLSLVPLTTVISSLGKSWPEGQPIPVALIRGFDKESHDGLQAATPSYHERTIYTIANALRMDPYKFLTEQPLRTITAKDDRHFAEWKRSVEVQSALDPKYRISLLAANAPFIWEAALSLRHREIATQLDEGDVVDIKEDEWFDDDLTADKVNTLVLKPPNYYRRTSIPDDNVSGSVFRIVYSMVCGAPLGDGGPCFSKDYAVPTGGKRRQAFFAPKYNRLGVGRAHKTKESRGDPLWGIGLRSAMASGAPPPDRISERDHLTVWDGGVRNAALPNDDARRPHIYGGSHLNGVVPSRYEYYMQKQAASDVRGNGEYITFFANFVDSGHWRTSGRLHNAPLFAEVVLNAINYPMSLLLGLDGRGTYGISTLVKFPPKSSEHVLRCVRYFFRFTGADGTQHRYPEKGFFAVAGVNGCTMDYIEATH